MLKILVVGNTNNYPFMLSRALDRQGHHVVHVVDQAYALHRPQNRYHPEEIGAVEVLDLAPLRLRSSISPRRHLRAVKVIADQSDLVILNGTAPRVLDIHHDRMFMLYTGSDLTDLAGSERETAAVSGVRSTLELMQVRALEAFVARRGRRQLRDSLGFSFFPPASVPLGEVALARVGPKSPRLQFLMSDATELAHTYQRPADRPDFRIFNVARISWHGGRSDSRTQLDFKGTDILLRGFREFLDQTSADATLVLVRKGPDVERAVSLSLQLKIASRIEWLEEMSQKQVFAQYSMADVVTENLGPSLLGMGGLDALGFGVPVIAQSHLDSYDELSTEEIPVLEAVDENDVARWLSVIYTDREYRQAVMLQSAEFATRWLSPMWCANKILSLLN